MKSPFVLPTAHAEILLESLRTTLSSEDFHSPVDAIAALFVDCRKTPVGDPAKRDQLKKYSFMQLRSAIGSFSKTEMDSLFALCKGQHRVEPIPGKRPTSMGFINTILANEDACTALIDKVAANPDRVRLAIEYDVPLTVIPALLTHAVYRIGSGIVGEILRWDHAILVRPIEATLHKVLPLLANHKPEWHGLGTFYFDRTLKVLRPHKHAWNYPPSHEELDVYHRLKGETPPPQPKRKAGIPSSLGRYVETPRTMPRPL